MPAAVNRQVLLRPPGRRAHPGQLRAGRRPRSPSPAPARCSLRTIYLSLDPYMRGRMNAGPSYATPVEVGEVMEGGAVGEVVRVEPPRLQPRATSSSRRRGWQEYALSDGKGVRKLDPALGPALLRAGGARDAGPDRLHRPAQHRPAASPARRSSWRRPPGRSARSSGRSPRSRAAASSASPGASGSAATSTEELGFDACLDHRQPDLPERLKAACPGGHRRLLRERRRGGVRRGAAAAERLRPRPGLRPHRPLQRHRAARRAGPRARC